MSTKIKTAKSTGGATVAANSAEWAKMMLQNQQKAEMANPSSKPLCVPTGVPGTRWKLLDSRMRDRKATPPGTRAYQNGSDLYATEKEASDEYAPPMDVVGSYVMPELDEEDETMDPVYESALVWPPPGSSTLDTSSVSDAAGSGVQAQTSFGGVPRLEGLTVSS